MRRLSRTLLATTVVGVLLSGLAPRAFSDSKGAARREAHRRVQLANDYYGQGRYEEALRLYQAAYDIFPDTRILFNLGLAHEKTFDYERCALSFRHYIDAGADEASVERAEQRLQHCLTRTVVPVKLTSWPPNAAVSIVSADAEGEEASNGRTPVTVQLRPGRHALRFTMPGHRSEERTVDVEPGERPSVDLTLERLSTLHVEADVSGATATIDDGKPEPLPLTRELPAGIYSVAVARDGHYPVNREVRVSPGQSLSLVVTLKAKPSARRLSLRAPRSSFLVLDHGDRTAAREDHEVLSGRHHIEVSAVGRIPYAGSIEVPEDRDVVLKVDLAKRRTGTERAILWGLLGTAGASLIAGTYFGVRTMNADSSYDALPSARLLEEGRSDARRADMFLGAAVGLAATAGVYYLVTRPGASRVREVER